MTYKFKPINTRVNAKINLGLNVVEKRTDGFHNIETIFYPTDYFTDYLSIKPSDKEFSFYLESDEDLGEHDNNLCVKAFYLLRNDFGISGVEIHLKKGIPSGAGLGGGSADAAFTLKSLKTAFNLDISKEKMVDYALRLGSDVPFFLENRPVFASGRGEILNPINLNLDSYSIEIVKPDVHVSTKEAYGGVSPHKPSVSLTELVKHPIEEWKCLIINDFEESIFKKHPCLLSIKQEFYEKGAIYAAMSGSGSAIFGIYKKKAHL